MHPQYVQLGHPKGAFTVRISSWLNLAKEVGQTRTSMQFHNYIFAESAWLYRLLRLGPRRISLTGDTVRIEGQFGVTAREIPVTSINEVTLQRSCFWRELTVSLVDRGERSIGGLAEREAADVRDAILEGSAKIAESWGKRLQYLVNQLSAKRYMRHSNSLDVHAQIVDFVTAFQHCGQLVRKLVDDRTHERIGKLAQLFPIEVFEKYRKDLNEHYIRRNVVAVKDAAGKNLTNEQAKAIATDEDVTLVLAGAGTGKTKVIVGKIAHLVRNQTVDPSEILVLAFNVKAAEEIRERLPTDLSKANVFNFHAFGYDIIGKCEGKKRPVSKLAADEYKLKSAIDGIIRELLRDPRQSQTCINFILSRQNRWRSPFDFKTIAEYEGYVGGMELRTLSGDLVKSLEELVIANFLTLNGIEFRYESTFEGPACSHSKRSGRSRVRFCHDCPHKVPTTTMLRRQYQPDFFLPNYDIYIEHFALDEKGNPPTDWHDYKQGVEWKRTVHKKYGTMLLETYSWQHQQDVLLGTLHEKLEELGVEFNPIPVEAIIGKLGEERISWLSGLLANFLNHVKTSSLNIGELRSRANYLKDSRRAMAFLDVFCQVQIRYEQLLRNAKEIDFHDQINLAANHVQQGGWEPPYRYVLVDEFQDISKGRMRLLQSLNRRNVAFLLVGDDWQSIYRFAGSDVGLIGKCGDYLGYVQEQTLTRTFRFKDGILDPSTKFIHRNTDQTQRDLRSESNAEDKGITIVATNTPDEGFRGALQDIEAKAKGKEQSVLVLGRYKSTGNLLLKDRRAFKSLRIESRTVHSAKGREADYVVVLDLKDDDRWGFPCKIEDDPLLDIVLPPASGKSYPFAEERRLFYVAMTRARIGAYLVADATHPSDFVKELQTYSKIKRIGEFAEKCPRCGVGVLVEIPGRYGPFLGCTEYRADPSCSYKRPIQVDPDDASDEDFWQRFSYEDYST